MKAPNRDVQWERCYMLSINVLNWEELLMKMLEKSYLNWYKYEKLQNKLNENVICILKQKFASFDASPIHFVLTWSVAADINILHYYIYTYVDRFKSLDFTYSYNQLYSCYLVLLFSYVVLTVTYITLKFNHMHSI